MLGLIIRKMFFFPQCKRTESVLSCILMTLKYAILFGCCGKSTKSLLCIGKHSRALAKLVERKKVFLFQRLGKGIKGTVVSVVVDNLRAHSMAGFVESLIGPYVCQFCVGERFNYMFKSAWTWACMADVDDLKIHCGTCRASSLHRRSVCYLDRMIAERKEILWYVSSRNA